MKQFAYFYESNKDKIKNAKIILFVVFETKTQKQKKMFYHEFGKNMPKKLKISYLQHPFAKIELN